MKQINYKEMMEQAEPSTALIQNTKNRMKASILRANSPKKHINRLVSLATCFAVLLLGVVAIQRLWNNRSTPQSDFVVVNPTSTLPSVDQAQITNLTPEPIPEISIASTDEPSRVLEITGLVEGQHSEKVLLMDGEFGELNFIQDAPSLDMAKIYIDPETTYKEEWNWEKIVDYMGVDFRPQYIPEDLYDGDEDGLWKVYFNNDGSMAYATFHLWYLSDYPEDNPFLNRELRIEVEKGGLPIQCALYMTDKETSSNINGVEIAVGHRSMSYGPYVGEGEGKTPAGYYDVYIAEFMHNNIGYHITSDNLTQEEFINVLLSIVK